MKKVKPALAAQRDAIKKHKQMIKAALVLGKKSYGVFKAHQLFPPENYDDQYYEDLEKLDN